MAYPKQIKKTLKLVPDKELSDRRKELSQFITKNGTYLPKSVLHADLDRGMLDFVKEDLKITTEGKVVPMVDILLTTQNWSQYLETWTFTDSDFNAVPPFITVVRQPEVKYGTNPALQYTIPNRKQFYFAAVPTWNGNQNGMDIYTIPQPVPVDINYSVKIVCLRMRELNQFNKVVLQKFSSRQAYTFIKGQYVPIIMTNISDESVMEVEKRKYYVQSYDFTMLGYLIDEEEFQVKPAISRVLQVFEIDESKPKRKPKPKIENESTFDLNFDFTDDSLSIVKTMEYSVNMKFIKSFNVNSYLVNVNGLLFGTNIESIPLQVNDVLTIDIFKNDYSIPNSTIYTNCELI
jgi:hypothetical protein